MIEVREPFSTEIFTLFKAYEFQVSVSSVLHGNLQGTVFVDEPLKPRTAVIMNPEGLFIVGNPENEAFGGSLLQPKKRASRKKQNIMLGFVRSVIEQHVKWWVFIILLYSSIK